jgi:hypothetical protein
MGLEETLFKSEELEALTTGSSGICWSDEVREAVKKLDLKPAEGLKHTLQDGEPVECFSFHKALKLLEALNLRFLTNLEYLTMCGEVYEKTGKAPISGFLGEIYDFISDEEIHVYQGIVSHDASSSTYFDVNRKPIEPIRLVGKQAKLLIKSYELDVILDYGQQGIPNLIVERWPHCNGKRQGLYPIISPVIPSELKGKKCLSQGVVFLGGSISGPILHNEFSTIYDPNFQPEHNGIMALHARTL